MKASSFALTLVGMHIIGTAVFFGYTIGPSTIPFSPFLSIFGAYMLIPETIILGLIIVLYEPEPHRIRLTIFPVIALIFFGALIAGSLIPKGESAKMEFWIGGLLAGAASTAFAVFRTHVAKLTPPDYKPTP